MNTYTFTLPKNTIKANNYKNKLISRIVNAYPWMTIDSKHDYPYSDIGIEYMRPGDAFSIGISNTHNISWLPKETLDIANLCGIKNYDLEIEFEEAISALTKYAERAYPFYVEKGYDFKDIFGRPVKIFDDFIQIGYDIIPRHNSSYFYNIKPETKKTVIDIIIKIKNNKWS